MFKMKEQEKNPEKKNPNETHINNLPQAGGKNR